MPQRSRLQWSSVCQAIDYMRSLSIVEVQRSVQTRELARLSMSFGGVDCRRETAYGIEGCI